MQQRPQRVVIVGAGFGGVHAYLALHKHLHGTGRVEITLINDGDRFEFIPLIHEVATGTLLPSGVSQTLRTLPQCCIDEFISDCVTAVDFERQLVHVGGAGRERAVPYDYLILGIGSETNYLDVPGAKQHTLPLKTLHDAIAIKNHILTRFEEAQRTEDVREKKALLRFVIAGGGPTGVEIAGEIGDLVHNELANAFPKLRGLASVLLIERGDRVLKKGIHPWFGNMAERILHDKFSVYVLHNTVVEKVTDDGLRTDHAFIRAGLVLWSAGVKARELLFIAGKEIDREKKTRRVRVGQTLQVPGYENVFVVGDQAWICDTRQERPYPMRAQFAVREGRVAGENIARLLSGRPARSFAWKEKGMIVSLGKGGALAEVFGLRFSGFAAWLIYRGAYLVGLLGWRARFRTALEWVLNIFLPRDISKL